MTCVRAATRRVRTAMRRRLGHGQRHVDDSIDGIIIDGTSMIPRAASSLNPAQRDPYEDPNFFAAETSAQPAIQAAPKVLAQLGSLSERRVVDGSGVLPCIQLSQRPRNLILESLEQRGDVVSDI